MAPTSSLPRPGEVVLRDGRPYMLCSECGGSGDAQSPSDPFCVECFGAGVAPLLSLAVRVAQAEAPVSDQATLFHVGRQDGAPAHSDHSDRFANRYPGRCKCGGWVDAGEGIRVRDGQGWAVQHRVGQCRQEPVAEAPSHKPNRYPGECPKCGQTVPAGEGALVKVGGRWGAEHVGQCPALPTERPTERPTGNRGLDLTPLERYASGKGMSGAKRVRVGVPGGETRLKLAITFRNGSVYVDDAAVYGRGAHYGSQRSGGTYRGQVQDELAAVLADPRAAIVRYAELTSSCGVCGAALEDEESVARGLGPICASKVGW